MNIERLLTLADFLDAAPDDFDIRAWPYPRSAVTPAMVAQRIRALASERAQ